MSEETKTTKRAFHEDIFADDADKWSWPRSAQNAKPSSSGVMYDTHTSEVKSESSSSLNSGEGFVFRNDSNSLKKNFKKRGSSCSSEGNQEDGSSSPQPSVGLTHERLIPSMYDDDARSGSPSSVFEKKDLAFRSSFKKSMDASLNNNSKDSNPFSNKAGVKRLSSDKEDLDKQRSGSPKRRDSRDSRSQRSSSDVKTRSSRSRSRSRDPKFKLGSKSRSPSHSRDRRGKSPQGRRRSRSRDRLTDRRRRNSRSRRSRSRESHRRSRSRSHDRHRRRGHFRSSSRDRRRRRRYSRSRSHSRDRSRSRGGRKPGSLPLSTSGGAMTPQMALQQTMAAMSAKAQALTGVALPKYYNPAAVNPLKYAEQVQKRKLLWQTKEKVEETGPKNSVWEKMTFAQDQDGKMTAKFRKLMGMKVPESASVEGEDKEEALKKQEELFRDLDQQYEMARVTTHTQRGVGLGYSSQAVFPVQK